MRAFGLTDGSAGMEAQVRALAEAMAVPLELQKITLNWPWKFLPNAAFDWGFAKIFPVITPEILRSLESGSQDNDVKYVISCGRKGALTAAYLRITNHELPITKFIHIQNPQMSLKHFDAVVAMAHDNITGANVINTPYALVSITPEKLSAEKAAWEPKFAHLPKPWNAVLIGGSTNKYQLTKAAMQKLITELEQISGSLLITTSRRTGAENIKFLSFPRRRESIFLYTGEGENPYMGMLACADKIYVTNDSVNMMSEALATGKPVKVLKLQGHGNTKPARFAEHYQNIKTTPQEMMKNVVESIRLVLAKRA